MKDSFLFLLLSFFSSQAMLPAQVEDPAIRVVEQNIIDFFAHDNDAYTRPYTKEAIHVNPMGMTNIGANAIHDAHAYLFNNVWKGVSSEVTIDNKSVRYLSNDIAIVTLTASFVHSKDGVAVKRGRGQVSTTVKKYADWKIELCQITFITPPPGE